MSVIKRHADMPVTLLEGSRLMTDTEKQRDRETKRLIDILRQFFFQLVPWVSLNPSEELMPASNVQPIRIRPKMDKLTVSVREASTELSMRQPPLRVHVRFIDFLVRIRLRASNSTERRHCEVRR